MHLKTAFGKDKNAAVGLAHACKKVVSRRNRSYHTRHKIYLNQRHAERRMERKLSPDNAIWAIKKLLSDAKRRSHIRDMPFSVTRDDIYMPITCPIFGCKLIYQAEGARISESASLDRIDSSRGYIPGNVWIISWRANNIKSDASPQELRTVADAVEKAAGRLLDGKEYNEVPVDFNPRT